MLIYLASPYSHPDRNVRETRFAVSLIYVAERIKAGDHIFSPIVYAHSWAEDYELPTDAAFWEAMNNKFIAACQSVYVLTMSGWRESVGVKAEVLKAHELDIPVYLVGYWADKFHLSSEPFTWPE